MTQASRLLFDDGLPPFYLCALALGPVLLTA